METPSDEKLAPDLRALRPTPRPEFAAELDERAAAGFPRRSRLSLKSPPDLFTAMRHKRPAHLRRLLLPGGGLAVIVLAIVTALVVSSNSGSSSGSSDMLSLNGDFHSSQEPAPRVAKPSTDLEAQAEEVAPASKRPTLSAAAGAGSASATEGFAAPGHDYNSDFNLRQHRAVERNAELVLGADPANVADDTSKVFEAVHAHDGIVMRSSIREGEAGVAAARFELLIPSAKLGDALAALSAIDEVRSRHEATDDITAPTVQSGELLQDSKARIDSLLAQLEAAEAESEREAVEGELASERRRRARLRAQLQHLERRADYSRVLVRIETGASEDSSSGGAWGIDDAMGDAGHILAVAAAVAVVALAVLGPIALVALLAWLTHRAWVRRERRRVLS